MDISRRRPIGNTNKSFQSPIQRIPEGASYRHYDSNTEEESDDRRPIRNINKSFQSPTQYIPEGASYGRFDSNAEEESDDYIDSNDETDKSTEEWKNTTLCNCVSPSIYVLTALCIVIAIVFYFYPDEQSRVNAFTSIKILTEEFPSQVEDFWLHIEEGVKDIKRFHKPRTFILLYTNDSEETLKKILKRFAEFATCTLTCCMASPVLLTANVLSDAEILKDYGEIITRNKEKLQESGVMIIENLEKVPSLSAQAFHSFCDEYNPVVNDALFIFTMKVNEFHGNDLKFVERYLRHHWNDIRDDHFYPLFTRIANVVLPIMVENE